MPTHCDMPAPPPVAGLYPRRSGFASISSHRLGFTRIGSYRRRPWYRAALLWPLLGCLLGAAACGEREPARATTADRQASALPRESGESVAATLPAPDSVLTVTDDSGATLAGAMLSFAPDARRRVTRFTDGAGQFDLRELPPGIESLEIRYPGRESRILLPTQAGAVSLDPDPDYLRALPSSRWLELLPDEVRKREFTLNCATCHEIAHDRIMLEGAPRDEAQWLTAIKMMRAMDAYEVIPPDFDDAGYATWLAEHLNADAVATLGPAAPANADALGAIEITEFALPESGSLPHDLVAGPDGRIWITAFFYDELWALDPDSGAIERFSVDTRDTLNAQPRALEFDAQGTLWLVNGGTESVLRFDPETGDYDEIPVGMYAHSIDLGPDGEVWVNDYFAAQERLARVNPADNGVTVIPVPQANRPASEGLPLPYGLQVDRLGRVYSTQLAANTLVRYDARDGTGQLYEMPVANSGPRRPGLDRSNRLWIPEFNTGYLALFDPEADSFSRVRLGDASLGLYDVEVNQANDEVWATGSLASTLIRYTPATGEILSVPLPTEPAYTRHIAVDEASGDVWTAYSSLPPADPRVVRVRFLD